MIEKQRGDVWVAVLSVGKMLVKNKLKSVEYVTSAAHIKAVEPSLSWRLTSAPQLSSSLQISTRP